MIKKDRRLRVRDASRLANSKATSPASDIVPVYVLAAVNEIPCALWYSAGNHARDAAKKAWGPASARPTREVLRSFRTSFTSAVKGAGWW